MNQRTTTCRRACRKRSSTFDWPVVQDFACRIQAAMMPTAQFVLANCAENQSSVPPLHNKRKSLLKSPTTPVPRLQSAIPAHRAAHRAAHQAAKTVRCTCTAHRPIAHPAAFLRRAVWISHQVLSTALQLQLQLHHSNHQ